MPYICADHFWL